MLCTQVNTMFVMLLWVCIHTGQAEKFAWPRGGHRTRDLGFGILVQHTQKCHILEYIDIEGTTPSSEIW
jgi:hypothetical protein